ncbi:MAG: TadE family protein [Bacteriovoracia bacterium]
MLMHRRKKTREGGQALIEFIMIIPIVMTFVWYLLHVGVVINKSIVGQKAARSQLFLKLYNHRSGPVKSEFGYAERSHFYIGVSSEVTRGVTKPKAPTEMLGVGSSPKLLPEANDEPGEPESNAMRQRIRVRTIFGICTHRKKNKDGVGLTDFCGADPSNDGTAGTPPPAPPGTP